MEPLDSVRLTSQTDIINLEDVECRTPSPVTSCAGSDCSISAAKAVAAAEAAIEERNDVILRLMGHLIPVSSTGPEEGSASETDTSIVSSASTFKRRLHSSPTPSEAIKLADRVAVLNRRIRRERDIYLHLQSLSNRIEEKDEGDVSTTDSSRTVKSTSDRHQGQINNARARRRERLNSSSAVLQNQMSSDLQLCSPGLSSPEPLTLKEIREDLTEEMDKISSEIKAQYCFQNGVGISNSHFGDVNYFKDGLTNCNLSSETENPRGQGTTSSTASSTGADYPYVTRKRTPMKFGGYRPSSGLIFRNLSSDSESDAISDGIVHKGLRSRKYLRGNWTDLETHNSEENEPQASATISRNSRPNSDGMTEVESFSVKKIEASEDRLLSPVPSSDARDFFGEPNANQKSETCSELQISGETGWTPKPSNERNHRLDGDVGNMVEQNILVDSNADNFENDQPMEEDLADSSKKEEGANVLRHRTYDTNTENSLDSVHHVRFSKTNHPDPQSLTFRKVCSPNHGQVSNLKVSGIANQQSVPTSSRSQPERISKSEDLRHQSQNNDRELVAVTNSAHMESDDDLTDNNVYPKIPLLEIESHDCSQSHSLSSEGKGDETSRSSLDVNALIQALSDVSLKQKNSMDCTDPPMAKLKSPFGYGNRFSGSSGPRSSEYTPAAGGSRQSLTSLEVSEAHSVKISRGELTARRQATSLLKSGDQSARSTSKTVSEALSTPPPNIKKSPIVKSMPLKDLPLEHDLFGETRLIPVVAKVDKTNIVCSKHPLRIKSIARLISPRKYPSSEIRGEIVNQLTSRTEVSQSSVRSRKSFRSLKSVQNDTKVHKKKADGLQQKTNSAGPSAPLSGRTVLKPLNLVPKIKPELLTSMDHKLKRREKIANDLSEIINSQFDSGSERTTTASSNLSSSRRSPLSRNNRTDFTQRLENPGRDARGSSAGTTPGKPSTERDHKLLENSIKSKMNSNVSSRRSSVTSDNVLYLHSEPLSLSSDDCEGKMSLLPSPRDEALTKNDKLYDQQKLVNEGGRKTSEAIDKAAQCIKSSDLATNTVIGSVRNCVHINDLQDGREVTLPCGNSGCQGQNLRETELFNRLPNEIIGSLTRHIPRGTEVTENLDSTKETPSTIESLRRNIQENSNQWIRNFQTNEDSKVACLRSADGEISSNDSSAQYRKSSRNLLSNRTKIPQKIPLAVDGSCRSQLQLQKAVESTNPSCSGHCVSGQVNPGTSDPESSSPFHENMNKKTEDNSEPGHLDSQRSTLTHFGPNSHRNTYRSVAESTDDDHEVNARRMTEQSPIDNESCDIEVISNATKVTTPQLDSNKAPFLVHPSDPTSDLDKHDRKVRSFITDAENCRQDDAEAVENMPSKNLGNSDVSCEQSEEKIAPCDCEQKTQFEDDLKNRESSLGCLSRCSDNGFAVREKVSTPNSTRSAKSQTVTQHHQDGIISSSLSVKTSSSMSKVNLSADLKRDVTVVTGANSAKKSQDRFPFTMSESASRKTSKFKVVADVNLDQLIQDQNSHAKPNDTDSTQNLCLAKSGDREIPRTDGEKQTDANCEQNVICQVTPFLEEFTSEISHNSLQNLNPQIPFIKSNYMSYGCREEPRTLMPNVKEMVKKLSAKLRYARTKRCQDTEETEIEILYRNIKCRCESGEGSSSAASLYQSQLLNTSNKLHPSSIRRSNDSRASSGKAIKPRRNHQCISMSTQHSPRRGCDQNDLWIQEFDSDSEFDTLPVAHCKKPNESCTKAKGRTSSPENDRYSMFMARRKLSGIINKPNHYEGRILLKCSEGGDNEIVHCKRVGDVDEMVNEVPETLLKSARIPASSRNGNDNTKEFLNNSAGGSLEDFIANSGCCCFGIYQFLVKSKKRGPKTRRRINIWKKK